MITLHGFSFSNYYNIIKHALMYKGIPFEERLAYPNTPEIMPVNPVGKVPAMTTEQGVNLSESSVLADYLEDAYPEKPLYPSDAEARARVRQLMKVSELYLDLPARRLIPVQIFNMPADEALLEEVRAGLERGARSINALASFAPYLAGDTLTLADIYLRYAMYIPMMVGPPLLDWHATEEISGLADWLALMADSDISRKIDADLKDNEPEFRAFIASRYG